MSFGKNVVLSAFGNLLQRAQQIILETSHWENVVPSAFVRLSNTVNVDITFFR